LCEFKTYEFKLHDPKKMCVLETNIQCLNHRATVLRQAV